MLIQHIADLDLESLRDLRDDRDGRITRGTFEIADIGPVETCLIGKSLLAQALCLAQLSQVLCEAVADIFHIRRDTAMSSCGLQTISDIRLDFAIGARRHAVTDRMNPDGR